MKLIILWLIQLVFASSITCLREEANALVELEDGTVLGSVNSTIGQNKTYYAFRGIPYAKPPVGDLRFKAPEKNEKWNGTLNATQDKSECIQGTSTVTGSEDCLYVNVYTPSLNVTGLSVMVWIHGGSFLEYNSSYEMFGPDYLLEQDVIYVSFNYRLGVLGFLSTEDLTCPGNWGLKDQALALKWVQNNIASFGGNQEHVTVFGWSSGSASVFYLLQSTKLEGYFQGAIMESGASLAPWALNTRGRNVSFAVGNVLGIDTNDSSVLVKNLTQTDAETLQVAASTVLATLYYESVQRGLPFAPVIEPEHDEALVTQSSYAALSNGDFIQVPVIIGMNSLEASQPILYYLAFTTYYQIDTPRFCPYDMTQNLTNKTIVGQKIKNRYFGCQALNENNGQEFYQFITDQQFTKPIRKSVELMANYTDVFYYLFSYEGTLAGMTERLVNGVGHAEELSYIFRSYYNGTEQDYIVRTKMVELWTNFAKYRNPTPSDDEVLESLYWPTVNGTGGNLDYLNINTTIAVSQNMFESNMDFYEELYVEYGEPPYLTY